MKQLFERLDEATARMDQVICIAGAIGGGCDAIADALTELLEEDDDTLRKCFGEMPEWLTEELGGGDAAGAFSEWALRENKLGFAVQIATPVMEHDKHGATYSWGYYRTAWVYGDTFEEAVNAGLAAVAEQRASEKKKKTGGKAKKRPNGGVQAPCAASCARSPGTKC